MDPPLHSGAVLEIKLGILNYKEIVGIIWGQNTDESALANFADLSVAHIGEQRVCNFIIFFSFRPDTDT
jgi:hypothetical protein